jgi:hypothetical protein
MSSHRSSQVGITSVLDFGGSILVAGRRAEFRSRWRCNQPKILRLSADILPLLWSATSSKLTFSPSRKSLWPARSTALMWMKASLPPLSGSMKPNPFWALNHFTVPVIIENSFTKRVLLARETGPPKSHFQVRRISAWREFCLRNATSSRRSSTCSTWRAASENSRTLRVFREKYD